jgi:hypothetical protein
VFAFSILLILWRQVPSIVPDRFRIPLKRFDRVRLDDDEADERGPDTYNDHYNPP